MSGRWGSVGAIVLVTGLLCAQGTRSHEGSRTITPRIHVIADKQLSEPTCVQSRDGIAIVNLPPGHWRIVIGSLGDASRRHEVHAALGEPAAAPTPLAPLPRLMPARPTSRISRAPQIATDTEETEAYRQRVFWLHVTDGPFDDPRHYARIDARIVAENQRIAIYADYNLPQIDEKLTAEILALLREEVIPAVEGAIAPIRDVDHNGKLTVLLTPWLNALQGGQVRIQGCVRPTDFQPRFNPPYGNCGDILYLNASLRPGPLLRDVLRHELTHAAAISVRLTADARLIPEADWLNEGIAYLSEREGANLKRRLEAFHATSSQFPLVVNDYHSAGLWRSDGCRGAAFLFLNWCRDRFGVDLASQLVHARKSGVVNLEDVTQNRFDVLFRNWTVASARSTNPAALLSTQQADSDSNRKLQIAGTAFAVVTVENASKRALTIQSTPDAQLQVTIVPTANREAEQPKFRIDAE